jgi:hypothetical protein
MGQFQTITVCHSNIKPFQLTESGRHWHGNTISSSKWHFGVELQYQFDPWMLCMLLHKREDEKIEADVICE